MPLHPLIVLGAALLLSATAGGAADGLLVRKVIGQASARANTALAPGAAFRTAAGSKSELAAGTGIVRTGEKAEIESLPKGIVLKRGMTLVASAPGSFRKTVEVRAPGYRMKVRGTAQIAYEPGRALKIAALEGSITVSLDSMLGEFETLTPGQLLVINPSDSRLPEPVEIDLQRLVATSALVNGGLGPLETAGKIGAAGATQNRSYVRGELASTPLLLRGMDNSLIIDQAAHAAEEASSAPEAPTPEEFEGNLFHGTNTLNDPNGVTASRTYVFPDEQNAVAVLNNTTLGRDSLNVGRTQLLRVGLNPHSTGGVADDFARLQGNVSAEPDLFAGQKQALEFFTRPHSPTFGELQIEQGAFVHSPTGVDLAFTLPHGLSADGARIRAGQALTEELTIAAGGGDIRIANASSIEGGGIGIKNSGSRTSQTIVDHSKVAGRSKVEVGKSYTVSGIQIRNSSELAALAGSLSLLARRNEIKVDSSTLKATQDLLVDAYISETDNAGAADANAGVVTLRNAQLLANAIRVRAFANGGDALLIDGGTFKASQLIRLYAEGASTLRFRNNVTLDTALAILAGKTVEVDLHGLVKITGKAQIYTDQANFGKPGFGDIQASGGMSQGGFGSRPKF